MSHSSLVNVSIPADSSNYTWGRTSGIRCVTVHHMAGVLSAEQCGYIFQTPGRNGSTHYGVGNDGRIGVYVEEEHTAWANSNWASNCESVTIETSNCATGGDWPVSDAAYNSLIRLVADIAKRNGLGKLVPGDNLTWHRMFTSTACPGDYLLARIQDIANKANDINYPQPGPTPTPSQFIVGDIVRPISLVDYYGTPLISYHDTYEISSISGDRAVLSAGGVIWAALNTNNLEMVSPAPRQTIKWKDTNTTIMYINGETSLINLDNDSVVKTLSGEFIYVQETEDGKYVRTSYSKEHNQNYAVAKSALMTKQEKDDKENQQVIDVPVIDWKDVEETTKHIIGTTNLINVETGEIITELSGNFTYVQVTADGKYARTLYSKNKGFNNGVLLSALDDNLEQPEPTPEPGPEVPGEPFPGENPKPEIPGNADSESSESLLKKILNLLESFFSWFTNLFKKEK